EIFALEIPTPQVGRKRDCDETTMGDAIGRRNFRSPTPTTRRAGAHRSIDTRSMGVGLTISTSAEKSFGSRTSTPTLARIVPSAQGRWGCPCRHQLTTSEIEKLSLQVLSPPGRRGNVTPTEDDGCGVDDRRHQLTRPMEKISLQVLYPPRRRATG